MWEKGISRQIGKMALDKRPVDEKAQRTNQPEKSRQLTLTLEDADITNLSYWERIGGRQAEQNFR